MQNDDRPVFRVYTLVPRENAKDYWLNIGIAFRHKDGKGMNLQLQALPLGSKLVIREVEPEDDGGAELKSPDKTS